MLLLKKLSIIIFVLFASIFQSGHFPLEVAEIQTPNSIVNYRGQKLILVDFWATWCGPCRIAGRQLEYLQEQLKDELFIISVTDETHEIVDKFLKKHPSKLMIVRDVAGNIFKKYEVYSRPYAILFTADGKLVWKGHPSGLKYKKIRRFYRRHSEVKGKNSVEEFLAVDKVEKEVDEEDEVDVELFVEQISEPKSVIEKKKYSVNYYGTVKSLVADLKRVPRHFVKMENYDNFHIHIQSPVEIWESDPEEILTLLETTFEFKIIASKKIETVTTLVPEDTNRLWDTNQIDWGEDVVTNHLIGEERVQADNISIADFCLLLSNIKEKTFHYSGYDTKLYDWDLHYRFQDLMKTELLDAYGIKLERKQVELTYYNIK